MVKKVDKSKSQKLAKQDHKSTKTAPEIKPRHEKQATSDAPKNQEVHKKPVKIAFTKKPDKANKSSLKNTIKNTPKYTKSKISHAVSRIIRKPLLGLRHKRTRTKLAIVSFWMAVLYLKLWPHAHFKFLKTINSPRNMHNADGQNANPSLQNSNSGTKNKNSEPDVLEFKSHPVKIPGVNHPHDENKKYRANRDQEQETVIKARSEPPENHEELKPGNSEIKKPAIPKMSITTKTGALPVKLKFQAEEDPRDKLPKKYRMHNDTFHTQPEVVHDRKVVYEPDITCSKSPILLMIKSRPTSFMQRDTIRETYGSLVNLVFLMGESQDEEVQQAR